MTWGLQVAPPPESLKDAAETLFSSSAKKFLAKALERWEPEVESMLRERKIKKLDFDKHLRLPDFPSSAARLSWPDKNWKVAPLPPRLHRRHLDLGDVSPAVTDRFIQCLQQDVDGIQTDFDDGHCPTWNNQLQGWWNVYQHAHGLLGPKVPPVEKAPVLMLRPRAWNMTEHNVLLGGRETSGPLVDFGLLMYHVAAVLHSKGSGPFFYLSKLEGSNEAALWNRIFIWTQEELGLPRGTIRACVLIENVFAAFEMEEILWELREHSAGLNCGMWDYSASFINKFGDRPEFQLPDRSKYVSMSNAFLASYMQLVVATCKRRGAPPTGGMAAQVLDKRNPQPVIDRVVAAKRKEIEAGVEGFMVYDLGHVLPCRELWSSAPTYSQSAVKVTASSLLTLPPGGVTTLGLKRNIKVGVLFIASWLKGNGVVEVDGSVEDSATAEISRSQVWQWIRHRAALEEGGFVTTNLVRKLVAEVVTELGGLKEVRKAGTLLMEVVTCRNFPEFLTTLLSENHEFRKRHYPQGFWDEA